MFFNRELFLSETEKMNLVVPDGAADRFEAYARALTEKNKVMNLTAVTDADGIAVKHFADSVSILTLGIPQGAKLADIGTGAGFPGIPLLIMRPDLKLTFIDSTAKKIDFINSALDELGLKAETYAGRAEALARERNFRENFDYAVSRAVASLNVLSELCLPFVKRGGAFISMKGAKAAEELVDSENAFAILGAKLEGIADISLSDGFERKLITIRKTGETDKKYPRQYGQILKRPL